MQGGQTSTTTMEGAMGDDDEQSGCEPSTKQMFVVVDDDTHEYLHTLRHTHARAHTRKHGGGADTHTAIGIMEHGE